MEAFRENTLAKITNVQCYCHSSSHGGLLGCSSSQKSEIMSNTMASPRSAPHVNSESFFKNTQNLFAVGVECSGESKKIVTVI